MCSVSSIFRDDYRTLFNELRDEFKRARARYPKLRCIVLHAEPEEQRALENHWFTRDSDEGIHDSTHSVYCGDSCRLDPWAQKEVGGVTNDAGQSRSDREAHSTPAERSAYRRTILLGDPAGIELFMALAADGGSICRNVPNNYPTHVEPALQDAGNNWLRWAWMVFDIAWSEPNESLLTCERTVRIGSKHCPIDGVDRRLIGLTLSAKFFFTKWPGQNPGIYHGKIDDLFGASVHAIDLLLRPPEDDGPPNNDQVANALTLEGIAKLISLKKKTLAGKKYKDQIGPPDFPSRGTAPARWRRDNLKLTHFLAHYGVSI